MGDYQLMPIERVVKLTKEHTDNNRGIKELNYWMPFDRPEDCMSIFISFMRLATSMPNFGLGSKPMDCAMEIKRKSEFVRQATEAGLSSQRVSYLINLLGNAPDEWDFLQVVWANPETLHASVDYALAVDATRAQMSGEWRFVVVLTEMRQRLASQRW